MSPRPSPCRLHAVVAAGARRSVLAAVAPGPRRLLHPRPAACLGGGAVVAAGVLVGVSPLRTSLPGPSSVCQYLLLLYPAARPLRPLLHPPAGRPAVYMTSAAAMSLASSSPCSPCQVGGGQPPLRPGGSQPLEARRRGGRGGAGAAVHPPGGLGPPAASDGWRGEQAFFFFLGGCSSNGCKRLPAVIIHALLVCGPARPLWPMAPYSRRALLLPDGARMHKKPLPSLPPCR